MGTGESSHEQGMRRLGLEVVGRGVAVVLAARERGRLRPVARVVVLLAVEPAFQRVELLTSGRVRVDLRIQRLGDRLRGPPEALLVERLLPRLYSGRPFRIELRRVLANRCGVAFARARLAGRRRFGAR